MLLLFAIFLVLEQALGTRKATRIVRFFEGTSVVHNAVNKGNASRNKNGGSVTVENSNENNISNEGLSKDTASTASRQPLVDPSNQNTNRASNSTKPKLGHSPIPRTSFASKVFLHLPSFSSLPPISSIIAAAGPAGFSLRWINICFVPAFVTLPLTDHISAAEAFQIAAAFVIGYLITAAICVYMVWALQKSIGKPRRAHVENMTDRIDAAPGDVRQDTIVELPQYRNREDETNEVISNSDTNNGRISDERSENNVFGQYEYPDEHTHGDIDQPHGRRPSTGSDVMEAVEFGSSVTPNTTTAPEVDIADLDPAVMGTASNTIVNQGQVQHQNDNNNNRKINVRNHQSQNNNGDNKRSGPKNQTRNRVALLVAARIDYIFYGLFFISGVFVYWFSPTSYAMPAQLSLLVLCFLAAMQVPHKYRIMFHPILISAFLTVGGFYLIAIIYTATIPSSTFSQTSFSNAVDKVLNEIDSQTVSSLVGSTATGIEQLQRQARVMLPGKRTYGFAILRQALWQFKTGRSYLRLFEKGEYKYVPYIYNPKRAQFEPALPGAGDVISSLLDTSIVALAVPMFNYRKDLKRNVSV